MARKLLKATTTKAAKQIKGNGENKKRNVKRFPNDVRYTFLPPLTPETGENKSSLEMAGLKLIEC